MFCVAAISAAAVRVAERRDHTVSQFKLSTVLVATWPQPTSCAVSVTGFARDTPAEPIVWFFENPRRSGGGPVMELYYDEHEALAVVTFHNRQGELFWPDCKPEGPLFMVALWNRETIYIFMLWFVLSSSSSSFFLA